MTPDTQDTHTCFFTPPLPPPPGLQLVLNRFFYPGEDQRYVSLKPLYFGHGGVDFKGKTFELQSGASFRIHESDC